MTSDAADREKKLADVLDRHEDGDVMAAAIAAFVRSELATHEQAYHGTPAADPPAVEHKSGCATLCKVKRIYRGMCPNGHRIHTCDCGASGPKAGDYLSFQCRDKEHGVCCTPWCRCECHAPDREAPKPPDAVVLHEVPEPDTGAARWTQILMPADGVRFHRFVPASALTEALEVLRAVFDQLPVYVTGLNADTLRRAQALLARHGVR